MATELSVGDYLWRLALCALYITISGCVIRFNKHLMAKERFPYSMVLTAIHMMCAMTLCALLYAVRPALFPSMEKSKGQRQRVLLWFLPISAAFAISLFASNQAYIYCSVSFLQFMKEGNVILSFLMSCAVGLQVMNRLRMAVIIWIMVGSSLAVSGELHFVLIGFVFQLVAQVAECSRAVMGEHVMSDGPGGLKLDPLSYTFFVSPMCLLVLLVGTYVMWVPEILDRLAIWWPLLVPNALLAFSLNLVVAAMIKETSAVGFILAGVVKDIAVVLVSSLFMGEVVTPMQATSFTVALVGIFFWSYMKVVPESPTVRFAETLLGSHRKSKVPDETTPLQP